MQFSDNSLIGAVLGTFFATLVTTAVLSSAIFYWIFVKTKKRGTLSPELGESRKNCGDARNTKASPDVLAFCGPHSSRMNEFIGKDKQGVFAVNFKNDGKLLHSIELLVENDNLNNFEKNLGEILKCAKNFPVVLRLRQHQCLTHASSPTSSALEGNSVHAPREISVDTKIDRNAGNPREQMNRPTAIQCCLCATKADVNQVTRQTKIKDDHGRESFQLVPAEGGVDEGPPPLDPNTNVGMQCLVDGVGCNLGRLNEGDDDDDDDVSYEITHQWKNPSFNKGRVLREKSTKGGMSYYVDLINAPTTDAPANPGTLAHVHS